MSDNKNQNEDKVYVKSEAIDRTEDLDLNKIKQIRGQTPKDIENRCLKICQQFIGGNWNEQTLESIKVRRITGGFMNQLYECAICEPVSDSPVPQEVAVKLYGQNIFEYCDKQRIRDNVISLVFSNNDLGPKVYGVFEGGIVQKYYRHRQFKEEEEKNMLLVKKVFQTLAVIHSWEVPVNKSPWALYDLMIRFYDIACDRYPLKQLMEDNNCQTLLSSDLKSEIQWIKGVLERSESPVVFTHNDFRSSNLLIVEPNDDLIVCDYDISGYGFRGYDFVAICRGWGKKQFEIVELTDHPIKDEEIIPLLQIYLEKSQRIFGESYSENPINTVEHLLNEVKIFLLLAYLFGTVFCLKMDEIEDDFPFNKKLCMQLSEKSIKDYFLVKKILTQQKII